MDTLRDGTQNAKSLLRTHRQHIQGAATAAGRLRCMMSKSEFEIRVDAEMQKHPDRTLHQWAEIAIAAEDDLVEETARLSDQWTTDEYRNSVSLPDSDDMFSPEYQWQDKPHRHVFDLCDMVDNARARKAWCLECHEFQSAYMRVINDNMGLKKDLSDETARNTRLIEALKEIAKGEGPYTHDQLEHADNCIKAMKELANVAIDEVMGGGGG